MKLYMNFLFFVVYDNNYSTVVYGGNIIRFPLNNNLEAQLLLYMFIFYVSSDLLMACSTMQLIFFLNTGNSVNLCL